MQLSPIHPPPSLASASRSIFAPCKESDSRTVPFLRPRGIERAATAVRSSLGMSVQPDIPIFVSTPPPSWDGGFLTHAEVEPLHIASSWAGRVGQVTLAAHTPYRVSVQPEALFPLLSRPPSSAKATRKFFQYRSFAAYLTFTGEMAGFNSCLVCYTRM